MNRCGVLLAAVFISGFFSAPSLGAGTTYYVSLSGSDSGPGTLAQPFLTINHGVKALVPGDTLSIMPGTYAESLKSVIPSGTDASHPIVVRAFDPTNRPVLRPPSGTDEVLYVENTTSPSHDILIDGLVLDGANTRTRASVVVLIGHHLQLMNCEIKNGRNTGVRIVPSGFPPYPSSDFNRLVNLDIHNIVPGDYPPSGGINIAGSHTLVEGCRIHNNNDYGVILREDVTGLNPIHDNTLTKNQIYGNRFTGINLMSGGNEFISNNLVYNNGSGIAVGYFQTVSGVRILSNTIDNNNVTAGKGVGVVANFSRNMTIANNVITRQQGDGVYVFSSDPTVLIKNNLFAGIHGKDDGGNEGVDIHDFNGVATISGNVFAPESLYQDPAHSDFHLNGASLGVDAGLAFPQVPDDLDGISRPQGGSYDIGAYEFVPTSDATSPSVPGGVTAQAVTCSTVTVSWQASTDTGGSGLSIYRVYRGGVLIGQVPASATSFKDFTTVGRAAYAYALSAVDANGNASAVGISVPVQTPACEAGTDYYVATDGSDAADGSTAHPWRTLTQAADRASPGDTVHVRPGTYFESVRTSRSGTAARRLRFISDVRWGAIIQSTTPYETTWQNFGEYVDIVGFDLKADSSGQTGIVLFSREPYVQILGNRVHEAGCQGARSHGIYIRGHDSAVSGNLVHDIGNPATPCPFTSGIGLYASNAKIHNNIVYRNAGTGITIQGGTRNQEVSNNLLYNNGGGGLLTEVYINEPRTTWDLKITNNLIVHNGAAGITENGGAVSNNRYVNNLVFGNASGMALSPGSAETGTLRSDPQFVNYQVDGSGDYHLQPGSPAIDAGTGESAPAKDFEDVSRPQGAGYDIGPYESGGAPPKILPAPTLNLPSNGILAVNARITASEPSEFQIVSYQWLFTVSDGVQNRGLQKTPALIISQAAGAGFSTAGGTAELGPHGLTPGRYRISVTATDSSGKVSPPAQADLTLVSVDLAGVRVVPSPWRSDLHSGHPLSFQNLPANSAVKIFSLDGRWVKTLSNANGVASWNLQNDNGDPVASGIYLYRVTSEAGKAKGKFVIIR